MSREEKAIFFVKCTQKYRDIITNQFWQLSQTLCDFWDVPLLKEVGRFEDIDHPVPPDLPDQGGHPGVGRVRTPLDTNVFYGDGVEHDWRHDPNKDEKEKKGIK